MVPLASIHSNELEMVPLASIHIFYTGHGASTSLLFTEISLDERKLPRDKIRIASLAELC